MRKHICITAIILVGFDLSTVANQQNDTIDTRQLKEVIVEGRMQSTSATKSTYIPTRRQKNSAQTAPELLNHMAIPQLGLVSDNNVTTTSGQGVDLFIDYVPASGPERHAHGRCQERGILRLSARPAISRQTACHQFHYAKI